MRVMGVAGPPGRKRTGRRFVPGERVQATVLRAFPGRFALLAVEGERLLAWTGRPVDVDEELYLEVVTGSPSPRFRRLTGGGWLWSLPVGSTGTRIDTRG